MKSTADQAASGTGSARWQPSWLAGKTPAAPQAPLAKICGPRLGRLVYPRETKELWRQMQGP